MTAPVFSNGSAPADTARLPRQHAARLRHYWRSRGWACHDNIDLDLLRWALIEEIVGPDVASRFVLTDAGRRALGEARVDNRRAHGRHAEMTDGVAHHLTSRGRLVFTELAIHTDQEDGWAPCKPDVFSLTRSLRPDHLMPQVHEVKVQRSDLLGELRSNKTARYHELAAQLFFVIREGIAEPDEIPADYGVVVWRKQAGYTVARPAPLRACELQTRHWIALAKARPFVADTDPVQYVL